MSAALKAWQELVEGGIIPQGGTSLEYRTGGWRRQRPVRDESRCSNCLLCWIYCPDSAILVENGKIVGFDLDHCKGCGICARECPPKFKAIVMVEESLD